MDKLQDFGLLIFRIALSIFMLFGHGLGKFNKLISGEEIKFFDPFGWGSTTSLFFVTVAEFLAPMLIVFGLFTRVSSLTLMIAMFTAGFIYHVDDPFGSKEKALMYFVSYLFLFIAGPGKYSLSSLVQNIVKEKSKFAKFITL